MNEGGGGLGPIISSREGKAKKMVDTKNVTQLYKLRNVHLRDLQTKKLDSENTL